MSDNEAEIAKAMAELRTKRHNSRALSAGDAVMRALLWITITVLLALTIATVARIGWDVVTCPHNLFERPDMANVVRVLP